ncbi:PIN domain-like protein [Neolentinus lepideus HHB14362 ss-1]|uniref:PIN domain-like protein n=1 Tax=Neolentinus lepideus HHB14362 ss-1 TaxID=1314782 RepID=A0A165RBI8_9AGAM|nr:PIN domain-like protein [Neolentinus lepideus HHB14362 ss-1]
MGVNGLTTYLRENRTALSKTIVCPDQGPITVVVDGWSFIYELYSASGLPWVFGGEYKDFAKLVQDVVQAWMKIGATLFFVFDGPYPALKFSTLMGRVNEKVIRPSLLFFRTSSGSRSSPRFLNESQMLPPLCYGVCVAALQEIAQSNDALKIHFADEEGDPYAVELAGRIGGYVLGNDSDFVVLNSEGYLGYIPMSEVVWTSMSSYQDERDNEHTGDFQVVVSKKAKQKTRSDGKSRLGLIPPDDITDLSMTLPVYSPMTLASHLRIPTTLLPLLGALVGNDYNRSSLTVVNKRDFRSLFFDRRLTPSGRITHIAEALRTILSAASSNKRKQKHQLSNVMDLIDGTVSALLLRGPTSLSTGEHEDIVEKIVETTLQYAISRSEGTQMGEEGLWPTNICALHHPTACPAWEMINHSATEVTVNVAGEQAAKVAALYIAAYRDGDLSPRILDLISTATCWPRIFLENPDLENTARSIGGPIREWCYAILDHSVGLPRRSSEEFEEGDEEGDAETEDEGEDELIDVVEEQSDEETIDDDPLSPLQHALRKLEPSESTSVADTSASFRTRRRKESKIVTEYVRRGTRLAPEEVVAQSLSSLLESMPDFDTAGPIQLCSEEARFSLLLHILTADTPLMRGLDKEFVMAALALRWVVRRMHSRAVQNGNVRDRVKEMWTRREAMAFISSFHWPVPSGSHQLDSEEEPELSNSTIEDRSIQLMAQISAALEAITLLSHTLLLAHRVPSPLRHFSGRRFHLLLQANRDEPQPVLPTELMHAFLGSLDDSFAEEKRGRDRKMKGKKLSQGAGFRIPSATPTGGTGFFSLLAGMNND